MSNTESQTRQHKEQTAQPIVVVYDGECPVCQHFVKGVRLRQLAGGLTLISARDQQAPEVQWLQQQGVNLNDNMAVIHGEQMYQGAAAITWLSAMTTPSHQLNRLLFWLFRRPALGRRLYPLMRNGRLLLLRLLGRRPIDQE